MSQNLPVKSTEEFVADFETMDLSELKDKSFLVAVSTGDRNKHKFLTSTVHGPYTFEEMCDEVGGMWRTYQHHAKVVVCQKDRNKAVVNLNENTIDYIEAFYSDIIMESMIEGAFSDKEYTCKAGLVESDDSEAPKKIVEVEEEPEEEDL